MIRGWYFKACRLWFAGLAAAILLLAPATTMAGEEHAPWTVAYVDGAARTGKGNGVWWSMRLGEKVPPGNHIETGADGRVTLVRDGDSIEVAPESAFSVSHGAGAGEGEHSDIMQTLGRLLFRMESREARDFTVDTPVLAAAIKGTTFTVTVSANDSIVVVEEGSVEVTAGRTGEVALVEAGGSASVSRGGGLKVAAGRDGPGSEPASGGGPSDGGGADKADPDGSDSVDPGGADKTDPDGSDSVDPGGADKTDPDGSDSVDPGGADKTDPDESDSGGTTGGGGNSSGGNDNNGGNTGGSSGGSSISGRGKR